VNSEKVDPKTVQSWADLWRPEFKGRLLLPNDMRGVLGIGLKLLGHSLNSRDAAQIKASYEKLRPLMASVKVFDSDSPKQAILSGEVDLAVMWNGEAKVANEENPKIVYVYPREGFSMWMDNLSIPKGAKNVDSAYAFIDFIMTPEISARICSEMGYATPNKAAMANLEKPELENPIIYIPDEAFKRGEFEGNLGKSVSAYEKYWTLLKTK
jgi:spermidine/putrescine transport system substrate-binding protein